MTSPVSMPAGHGILAADFDPYENLTASPVEFTPTWTADVNPSIGNGLLQGFMRQVGKFRHYHVAVIMGSTTTFGTGDWLFLVPDAIDQHGAPSNVGPAGWGVVLDSGTAQRHVGCFAFDSTHLQGVYQSSVISPTVPHTWDSGDALFFHWFGDAA